MKTLTMILTTGLLAGVSLTTASAQPQNQVTASVPFDFKAGGVNFAASDYTITEESNGMLLIRDHATQNSAFVIAYKGGNGRTEQQTKVLFHQYGTQYFLEGVARAGDSYTASVVPSKDERQIRRASGAPGVLMLAARSR
ncbi:MAG: hypothetical protein M3Z85_00065 [Acidobacteriota bacterium]|nr:hypothetical protein [Acidobacteriota bacterium]